MSIKEKLEIECKIEKCWKSEYVIARYENEEEKREIMKNKYKLNGEKIFIKNDLTWEERKTQEIMVN